VAAAAAVVAAGAADMEAGGPAVMAAACRLADREVTAAACLPAGPRPWRARNKPVLLGQCKAVPFTDRMEARLAALAKPVQSLDPAAPPVSPADKPALTPARAAQFRWAALAADR
jgi:hypothetical protein